MKPLQLSLIAPMITVFLVLGPAAAQVPLFPDEFQRADVVAIERDGRDLYGFDSISGQRTRIRLEVDEKVFFLEARGRVGLVLTSRRAIAIGPGSEFQDLRYQTSEAAPEMGLVEDHIALVATSKRVLGFLGAGGVWV